MSMTSINGLPFYAVSAFSSELFKGNPAGVVLLDEWLPDSILQSIAAEANLSETAFLVGSHLRWFTPKIEVDLCGHATLATAHVLSRHQGVSDKLLTFNTRSGMISVQIGQDRLTLDFPIYAVKTVDDIPRTQIEQALNQPVGEILVSHDRYVCYLDNAEQIKNIQPDFAILAALPLPGLIITAQGEDDIDFVSRFFAPAKGVPEDPVTGTSHCVLAPLWGKQLNKTKLIARQLSARGGEIICELSQDRIKLSGQARTFSMGKIIL